MHKLISISFKLVIWLFISQSAFAQINIATGINGEVYHQFATDISNNTQVKTNLYSTKGSLENLRLLQSDSIQLAFIQYDVLFDKGKNNPNLQSYIKVFLPLYSEEIQLIVLKSSGIKTIQELSGKKVGMGDENSGSNFTANSIKKTSKINWIDINIPFEKSIDALINLEIDAFFYVGAVPSLLLIELPSNIQNQLAIANIDLPKINDRYIKKEIPTGTYTWQKEDIKTIAVKSLMAVNTNNVNVEMAGLIDSLYNDLKYNLKGIQLNKFSHPKWKSVDFSDMGDLDWTVFKEEYTMKERVLDSIGWLAAILSLFQIYFIINKLWNRKHEHIVAESISISAMFISIFINSFFAIKNISISGYAQLSNNLLWIIASSFSLIVGAGIFINANKKTNFFKLLLRSLNMERHEAGDLAKAFFQPSSADKIIEILGRLAMIDNDLDETEKAYIQKFANNWNIDIEWDEVQKYNDESSDRYNKLRDCLHEYLKTSPSKEQVSHLIDLIVILVNADGVVTREERLMESELKGIIKEYLDEGSDSDYYKVAVVPQTEKQEQAIISRFPQLERIEFSGGFIYISEGYYSEEYAEEVSSQYRSFHVFSIVFKPNIIKDKELMQRINAIKNTYTSDNR